MKDLGHKKSVIRAGVRTTHSNEQWLALVKYTILRRRGRVQRGLHSRDR